MKAPAIVSDYVQHMGGVDRGDRLRGVYGLSRQATKWWHRLFFGIMEMAFINSYVIYCNVVEKITLLEYRRQVTLGLLIVHSNTSRKRSSSFVKPCIPKKRRKFNSSVPDSVRFGNLGVHWPIFTKQRARCEMCSSKAVQSRPSSKCNTCGIFLCCNSNKNCFKEFHEK